MSETRRRVAVVMPAYNAEQTLERMYADVPKTHVYDIILVDDGSRDRTVEIARRLGIHVIVHPRNRGYGGNQKTCYRTALERGADINAANSLGFTALHAAANRGWESVIQLLVENGAKLDAEDIAGRSPLVFAQGVHHHRQ